MTGKHAVWFAGVMFGLTRRTGRRRVNWKSNPALPASTFQFTPPPGAAKIKFFKPSETQTIGRKVAMSKTIIITALAALARLGDNADAIVGRPLTPVSYAGVARRTARRTTGTAVVAPVPVAPVRAVAPVAVLPAGCGRTMVGPSVFYRCGSACYQPQYSGPNVLYVPVAAP